jgi:hypothetical protein
MEWQSNFKLTLFCATIFAVCNETVLKELDCEARTRKKFESLAKNLTNQQSFTKFLSKCGCFLRKTFKKIKIKCPPPPPVLFLRLSKLYFRPPAPRESWRGERFKLLEHRQTCKESWRRRSLSSLESISNNSATFASDISSLSVNSHCWSLSKSSEWENDKFPRWRIPARMQNSLSWNLIKTSTENFENNHHSPTKSFLARRNSLSSLHTQLLTSTQGFFARCLSMLSGDVTESILSQSHQQ